MLDLLHQPINWGLLWLFPRGKANMSIPQGTPSPVPLGPGHCSLLGIPQHAGRPGPVPAPAATSWAWLVWSPAASALYHMACCAHEASHAMWGSGLFRITEKSPLLAPVALRCPGASPRAHCGRKRERRETLARRRVLRKERSRRRLGQRSRWMQAWFLCALLRLTSLGQIKQGVLVFERDGHEGSAVTYMVFIWDCIGPVMNSHAVQRIKTQLQMNFLGKHTVCREHAGPPCNTHVHSPGSGGPGRLPTRCSH